MPVYKRGDTWYVAISIGGRRIRKSAGRGTTRAQAKQLEAKLVQNRIKLSLGEKPCYSIAEAMIAWLKNKPNRKTHNHVKALLLHIKGQPLREAHLVATEAKQAMLSAGLSAGTINRRLAILRHVANLAYREWE